jgi:hypothetical protein
MINPGFHIVEKTIERSYVEARRSYESAAEAFESAIGRYELDTAQALEARRAALDRGRGGNESHGVAD